LRLNEIILRLCHRFVGFFFFHAADLARLEIVSTSVQSHFRHVAFVLRLRVTALDLFELCFLIAQRLTNSRHIIQLLLHRRLLLKFSANTTSLKAEARACLFLRRIPKYPAAVRNRYVPRGFCTLSAV